MYNRFKIFAKIVSNNYIKLLYYYIFIVKTFRFIIKIILVFIIIFIF